MSDSCKVKISNNSSEQMEIMNSTESMRIAFIGEVSVGKTTIISALLQCVAGTIRKRKSTACVNIFRESTKIFTDVNEIKTRTMENDKKGDVKIATHVWSIPKVNGLESPLCVDIIDFPGVNDGKISKEIVEMIKKMENDIDIVCVVLDVTKGLTSTEKDLISLLNDPIKMYILTKFDDETDDELIESRQEIIDQLDSKNVVSLAGDSAYLSRVYAKHGHSLFNTTERNKTLLPNIDTEHNFATNLEKSGFNELLTVMNKIISDNIAHIVERKLKTMCTRRTDIASIIECCCNVEHKSNSTIDIKKIINLSIGNWCWNIIANREGYDKGIFECPTRNNVKKYMSKYLQIKNDKPIGNICGKQFTRSECRTCGLTKRNDNVEYDKKCCNCDIISSFIMNVSKMMRIDKTDSANDSDETREHGTDSEETTCSGDGSDEDVSDDSDEIAEPNEIKKQACPQSNVSDKNCDTGYVTVYDVIEILCAEDFHNLIFDMIGIDKLLSKRLDTNLPECAHKKIAKLLGFIRWDSAPLINRLLHSATMAYEDHTVNKIIINAIKSDVINKDTILTEKRERQLDVLYNIVIESLKNNALYKQNRDLIVELFYATTCLHVLNSNNNIKSVVTDSDTFSGQIPFIIFFKNFMSVNKLVASAYCSKMLNLKHIKMSKQIYEIYVSEILIGQKDICSPEYRQPIFEKFINAWNSLIEIEKQLVAGPSLI